MRGIGHCYRVLEDSQAYTNNLNVNKRYKQIDDDIALLRARGLYKYDINGYFFII